MNWDNIQQILRVALQILGGILIKDNAEAGQYWEAASAGIINIAAFGWMWFANRPAAQIAKTAALDEVKSITVTTQAVANAAPPNVKAA